MTRLFRHRFIACAAATLAVVTSVLAMPASAANMLLPNGTLCTFSGITVQMDGTYVLVCPGPAGGTAPMVYLSAPAQIPVSPTTTGMAGGAPAMGDMPSSVYVAATAPVAGDVMVMYDISGTGCYANGFAPPAMGGVTLASGTMQSQAIGIVATSPGSICSIAITTLSPMGGATIAPMSGMQSSRVDIPVGM
jgi:hypothetical protein